MVTELLLTGLFILLVLGLLVAFAYSMGHIRADVRTPDALAQDTPGQQRFFTASILNFLNQK
jgi:hypothetical protein